MAPHRDRPQSLAANPGSWHRAAAGRLPWMWAWGWGGPPAGQGASLLKDPGCRLYWGLSTFSGDDSAHTFPSDSHLWDQPYAHGNLRIAIRNSCPWERETPSSSKTVCFPSSGGGQPRPLPGASLSSARLPCPGTDTRRQQLGLPHSSGSPSTALVGCLVVTAQQTPRLISGAGGGTADIRGDLAAGTTCCSPCLRALSLDSFGKKDFHSACWQ